MFEDRKTEWLKKAENLKPELFVRTVRPASGFPDSALKENESIVLDFGNGEEMTTKIDDVKVDDTIGNRRILDLDGIFNLNGQRLDAPQKGINIINGRKVVIK